MAESAYSFCQLPDAADDREFQIRSFLSLVHARRQIIKMSKAKSTDPVSPSNDVLCLGPRVSSPIVYNIINIIDEPFTFGCAGFN